MDDGTGRQGSWEGGRERKAVRQSKTPPSDSQQRSMWIHLLNGCLMISRPRLCVGRSAGSPLSQRITALCGGVLLICLRVRLVMGERARQKGMGVHPGKRLCQE